MSIRPLPRAPNYLITTGGRVIGQKGKLLKLNVVWLRGVPYDYVGIRHPDGSWRRIHVAALVLETYVSPRPVGHEARHLNDRSLDNRLFNLAWGTRSDNEQDKLRTGNNAQANKTRCPRDHEYTKENTRIGKHGSRFCRKCEYLHGVTKRKRRRESKEPV